MFMRVSELNVIFIDAGVKINSAYYCSEVFLTQKLLRIMREIRGEFFIFQQGNALEKCANNRPSQTTDTCVCSFHQTSGHPRAQI